MGGSSAGREPQRSKGGVHSLSREERVWAQGLLPGPGLVSSPVRQPRPPLGSGSRGGGASGEGGASGGGGWGTGPGATAPMSPLVPQVLLQPLTPVLVDQGRVEPHPRVGPREGELDRSSDEVRRASAPAAPPGASAGPSCSREPHEGWQCSASRARRFREGSGGRAAHPEPRADCRPGVALGPTRSVGGEPAPSARSPRVK